MELAAGAFRVNLQYLDILVPKDFERAFRAAGKEQADAILIIVPSSVAASHRKEIVEFAIKSRVPATYPQSQYVEAGGLMSYGVSIVDLNRRAAIYVDKILKGAKPGAIYPSNNPRNSSWSSI